MALTGYNGILGYRTDQSYETRPDDRGCQVRLKWLDAHSCISAVDERKRRATKKVADAIESRRDGLFASHTVGASEW